MNIGEGAGEILIKLLHVFFRALLDVAIFALKKWENHMEKQPKTEKRVDRISKVRALIKKLQIKKLEDQNKEIKEVIKKIDKNLGKADKNIERYEINNEITKAKNEIEINKNYLEKLKKDNGDKDLINVVEGKLKDSQSNLEQYEKRFMELGNKTVSLESYNLALDKRSEYNKLLSINGDEINNNLKRISILEDQINRLEKKEEKPEKVLQELDKLKDRKDTINRYLNDKGLGKTEKERLLNEIDKIQDDIIKIEYKLNPDSYIENRYKHVENNNQEEKEYAKEKERNRHEEEEKQRKNEQQEQDEAKEKKEEEKNQQKRENTQVNGEDKIEEKHNEKVKVGDEVKEFIQTASDVELIKASNEILNNMEEMVKKNPELKNDSKFMETGKRMYGLLKKQQELEKEKHKEVNLKQNEILRKGAER
ncbi:hypothetical protein [uncultured Clostridium sp.]|uniref:hypothetical protein n=1 Tax=uncultured Clostridium sp. TaxID=59620 RepID=UPI0027DCF4F7|nr:hypothetical protein [uncultured Clostridium sp.]